MLLALHNRTTTMENPSLTLLRSGRFRLIRTTTSSLSRVDGEGGFAVIETDNQAGLLDGVSKFLTWLEFDIVPVVDITDAVSVLAAGAEYRESI